MSRKLPLKRLVGKINGGKALYFKKFKAPLKARCGHCFNDIKPGDTITIKGKVVEKKSEEGKNLVVCEVVCENQEGVAVIVATTTAEC